MKIHRRTSEVPEWTQPDLQARERLPDLAAPALLQPSSQTGLDPRMSRATTGQPHPSSPDQPPASTCLPSCPSSGNASWVPCTQHVPRPGRGWCYNEALPGGSRRREQRGGCLSTPPPPNKHSWLLNSTGVWTAWVQLHTDFFFNETYWKLFWRFETI